MKMNFVDMDDWMVANSRITTTHTHNISDASAGNFKHVDNTQMQQAQPRTSRQDRWQNRQHGTS